VGWAAAASIEKPGWSKSFKNTPGKVPNLHLAIVPDTDQRRHGKCG